MSQECLDRRSDDPSTAPGWAVVDTARAAVGAVFGERVQSWYVLGSLAHGGFAPLVSDVDVALVLDHVVDRDASDVADLVSAVKAVDLPLASRLSLFWGSVPSIAGSVDGGRFPPLDRLDLIESGLLLDGEEIRHELPRPSLDELIIGTADFVVEVLALDARRSEITAPAMTAGRGARPATKVALFPVRFLYTSRTGTIGTNEAAIEHYLGASAPGPSRRLVAAAAGWRLRWDEADAATATALLGDGAVALYGEFVTAYAALLRPLGRGDLADALESWFATLAKG